MGWWPESKLGHMGWGRVMLSIKDQGNWRRKWQPTSVFLPGKVNRQRSLAGCSPWDYMTEHVCMRVEGNGLVAIK